VDRLGVPSPSPLPQEREKKKNASPQEREKKKNASPQEREAHVAYTREHISHISKGSTHRVYPKRWRLMRNKQAKEKEEVPLLGERAG